MGERKSRHEGFQTLVRSNWTLSANSSLKSRTQQLKRLGQFPKHPSSASLKVKKVKEVLRNTPWHKNWPSLDQSGDGSHCLRRSESHKMPSHSKKMAGSATISEPWFAFPCCYVASLTIWILSFTLSEQPVVKAGTAEKRNLAANSSDWTNLCVVLVPNWTGIWLVPQSLVWVMLLRCFNCFTLPCTKTCWILMLLKKFINPLKALVDTEHEILCTSDITGIFHSISAIKNFNMTLYLTIHFIVSNA